MDKTTEDRINAMCDKANNEIDSQDEYTNKQRKHYLKKIRYNRLTKPFRG